MHVTVAQLSMGYGSQEFHEVSRHMGLANYTREEADKEFLFHQMTAHIAFSLTLLSFQVFAQIDRDQNSNRVREAFEPDPGRNPLRLSS